MNKVQLVVGIAVVLVIGVLAVPIKQRCGAPGYVCATAPDAQGNIHYYYEIEPLGILLIEYEIEPLGVLFTENVTGSNVPFYYTSGEDLVKVR